MVAEVVSSMTGDRSDRRFANLICTKALEAAQLIRRKRAELHQGQERSQNLLTKAEYMTATACTSSRQMAIRPGLGPYKVQKIGQTTLCAAARGVIAA
jgi:hypothetical protein